MRKYFLVISIVFIILVISTIFIFYTFCINNPKNTCLSLLYPQSSKTEVFYNYFGTKVPEPYFWLEDFKSKKVEEWIVNQNNLSNDYLQNIPYRSKIKERLVELWDYKKAREPFKKGGKYFIFKNNGLQEQSVLYYKKSIDGEEIELLNPNNFINDESLFLSSISVSEDGNYLGYAISKVGSDWQKIFVKDIENLKDLDTGIKWAKFSKIAWIQNGFFYTGHHDFGNIPDNATETTDCKIFFHKLGTPQEEDVVVYSDELNSGLVYDVVTSSNGRYLFLHITKYSLANSLFVKDLKIPNSDFVEMVDDFKCYHRIIDEINGCFYILTNYKASNYKIVKVDVKNPSINRWQDFISEKENVLKCIDYVGEKFIVNYMKDAHSVIKIFDKNGIFQYDLDNKSIGTIRGFYGENNDSITFYSVSTFTSPSITYKYNISKNVSTVYRQSDTNIDPNNYETKQVFFESNDGTRIPMFIVHKKGIEMNSDNPTILYGYGGFGVSFTPHFDVSRFVFLEQGGIFALVNARGGGEYGEQWYQSGTKMNKQNTFDDFISAAEYLINEKYTSPEKLAIQGGGNGGLLVAAVTNQRPDLFSVVLPASGIMDMLRYHLSNRGKYWVEDFGTSAESAEMFEYLYNYSPIHNIKSNVEYPAIFVTTSIYDERIPPFHSFKYVATLQDIYKGNNPILIRIDTKIASGKGKPTMKTIEEATDIYAFIFYNMDIVPSYIYN